MAYAHAYDEWMNVKHQNANSFHCGTDDSVNCLLSDDKTSRLNEPRGDDASYSIGWWYICVSNIDMSATCSLQSQASPIEGIIITWTCTPLDLERGANNRRIFRGDMCDRTIIASSTWSLSRFGRARHGSSMTWWRPVTLLECAAGARGGAGITGVLKATDTFDTGVIGAK